MFTIPMNPSLGGQHREQKRRYYSGLRKAVGIWVVLSILGWGIVWIIFRALT